MATPAYNPYGQQIVFDGYEAEADKLGDIDLLYKFLLDLPGKIGMTRIGFPHIIYIDEPGIKGLSGFVFIMESHISVHTYVERGFITIDVYSCKEFDSSQVSKHIQHTFNTKTHEETVLVRGKRFGEYPVTVT